MRWLTLYARSRQVPASAAAVALVAVAVWALNQGGPGPVDLGVAIMVLTANVAAASVGLGGPDVVLERTAAIRWVPRRAAHVLLIGVFAGAALLAVQAAGAKLAPTEVVLRDSAGLVGLAALGAALCGAQLAWTLPTGWIALALLIPAPRGKLGEVIHWIIFPAGTTASTATALALLATGTVVYALAGPRR
ncbi:hypothetical protein ACIGZJ_23100 [Kitasatospora sp. NPDC052868]|uniref:hypothetical protein n=1 Tax=Kitasatospora sp. NPDC052868 TaxID=3364060 RepID=UPI0037CC8727